MFIDTFSSWLLEFNRFSAVAGCFYFLFVRIPSKSIGGLVFFILLASLLGDNLNYFFLRLVYPNSFYIGNTWIVSNYLLCLILFRKLLQKRSLLLITLGAIFIIGTAISFGFYFNYSEANTFLGTYTNITTIYLCLLSYYEFLKRPSQSLKTSPAFWIVTSLFIYNSLLILISLFDNYLIFELKITAEAYRYISIINLCANGTKNYLLFYSLILIARERNNTQVKPSL